MTYITGRRSAALPLILGTIIALIATVMVGLISTPTQEADAAATRPDTISKRDTYTCSAWKKKSGNNLVHELGNLLGGVHIWKTEATYKDCDGFDLIAGIIVTLTKENGRCSASELNHINNYDFNPNVLGSWNAATRTIDCNSGQDIYNIGFVAPGDGVRVNSNDSSSERCIGVAVQIDIGPVKNDYNGTVPSVCFDGI